MVRLWYVTGPNYTRTPLEQVPQLEGMVGEVLRSGWLLWDFTGGPLGTWGRIEIEGDVLSVEGRAWSADIGEMALIRKILPPKSVLFNPGEEKDFQAYGRVNMVTSVYDLAARQISRFLVSKVTADSLTVGGTHHAKVAMTWPEIRELRA